MSTSIFEKNYGLIEQIDYATKQIFASLDETPLIDLTESPDTTLGDHVVPELASIFRKESFANRAIDYIAKPVHTSHYEKSLCDSTQITDMTLKDRIIPGFVIAVLEKNGGLIKQIQHLDERVCLSFEFMPLNNLTEMSLNNLTKSPDITLRDQIIHENGIPISAEKHELYALVRDTAKPSNAFLNEKSSNELSEGIKSTIT